MKRTVWVVWRNMKGHRPALLAVFATLREAEAWVRAERAELKAFGHLLGDHTIRRYEAPR